MMDDSLFKEKEMSQEAQRLKMFQLIEVLLKKLYVKYYTLYKKLKTSFYLSFKCIWANLSEPIGYKV